MSAFRTAGIYSAALLLCSTLLCRTFSATPTRLCAGLRGLGEPLVRRAGGQEEPALRFGESWYYYCCRTAAERRSWNVELLPVPPGASYRRTKAGSCRSVATRAGWTTLGQKRTRPFCRQRRPPSCKSSFNFHTYDIT